MRIDPQQYNRDGFFIVREAIYRKDAIAYARWYAEHRAEHARDVLDRNPVEDTDIPGELSRIPERFEIAMLAAEVMGEQPNLYNYRLVVKDDHSRGPVPCHQDIAYHCGGMNKASIFLALTVCDEMNGGLCFYPGTHKFGHLGDAGHINPEMANVSSTCPHLLPGDAVIMNSYTWHSSGPHQSGPDRVIADMIWQPHTDNSMPGMYEDWFINSRLMRLKKAENAST